MSGNPTLCATPGLSKGVQLRCLRVQPKLVLSGSEIEIFEMDLSLLLLQGDPFTQVSLCCVVLFILILVWQVSTMKLKKAVLNTQVRHPTGGRAKKGYEYFNQRKFAYFSRVNKFLNQ